MKHGYFPGWDEHKDVEVIESDGIVRVIVKGQPYMRWDSGDEGSKRMAIVQLYESGLCIGEDLASVFGINARSVQRHIADFARDGMRGLISQRGGPKARWKLTPRLRAKILVIVLKEGVFTLEAIQKRLEDEWNERVSLSSIRQVLLEDGLIDARTIVRDVGLIQGELFDTEGGGQLYLDFDGDTELDKTVSEGVEEEDKEVEKKDANLCISLGTSRRCNYSRSQRAYLDQLEQGDYNAYAGGLLFTPLLEWYSFLPTVKRVIDFPTYEGYCVEELCLTLFYFDVFGFRSMEDFKRVYPEEFGVLIGRSYSPSLFTLRRFLHRVRELQRGERLIEEFAVEYLKSGIARWGVLYIDGHFLPYYGVYPVTKGWHGVRQMPMKGSYNFLGVDDKFNPWIFLVRSSSEDLLEKIPEIIEKAKKIGKEAGVSQEELKSLVVVFDREGYSAELFRYLDGRDKGEGMRRATFITWAKYADKWVKDIPEDRFDKTVRLTYEIQESKDIKCFETHRRMSKYGKIRTIVVQREKDNNRVPIYTNGKEEEISAERIVQLICRRWGQENLIKELMMKHLINYMPGYVIEQMEEQPMIDNPKIKELKKRRSLLASELHRLKVQLADHILRKGQESADWEEIRRSELQTLEEIARVDNEILFLNQGIEELPARIRFDQAHDGEMLMKLNYEKKRFLDCIKVFTYNIKEKMCQLLLNYYGLEKDILPALSMIVERAGYVKLEDGRLRVKIKRFKNREIDYAARHLCEDLNSMKPATLDRFHFPILYEVQ